MFYLVNDVRYLLKHKRCDVNHLDVNKKTALMLTADKKGKREDSYALVQLLSKKGAIVNIQRNEGNTAMMLFATMTGWILSTSSSTTLPWKLTWQGPI